MNAASPLTGLLKAAPIIDGCMIVVEGRGTMKLSQAVQDIARRTLEQTLGAKVVVDLTDCTYLDSTFIGCLLMLFRRFGRDTPLRFHLAATAPVRERLLALIKLDQIIPTLDAPPPAIGESVEVETADHNPRELAEHVMTCHQRLAQIPGPMAAAFAHIADQMRKELGDG